MEATVLEPERFFAGDLWIQRFAVVDRNVDEDDPPPRDLTGLVVRWALSRRSGTAYATEPDVAKSTDADDGVESELVEVTSAVLAGGGSGYAVGDVLVLTDGEGLPASIRVLTLGGSGAVATFELVNGGTYSVAPTNPAAATVDGNDSCTLTLTTKVVRGAVLVTCEREDTEDLLGDFHQELEIVDANGRGRVEAEGDVTIRPNVRNP